MKLITAALVGVGTVVVGKYVYDAYRRHKRGVVVVPKSQAALQVAYEQAMREVANAAARAGIEAQVVPGLVKNQPGVVVILAPGVPLVLVARAIPLVAAGLPVQVVGGGA